MTNPLFAQLFSLYLGLVLAPVVLAIEPAEPVESVESTKHSNPLDPGLNTSAERAVVEFKKLLEALTSVSADFHQQLYSADDYEIQNNQGHMQVSAPGKIRWLVDSPMEQWLISDGETLWLYDPDLEQVIIKPFEQNISAAPALLLTGSVSELSEVFEVSEMSMTLDEGSANQLNVRRFKLRPRDNRTLYEYLTFDFDGPKPRAITIVDALGQRTKISFNDVVVNEVIDDKLYTFEPPPDIDVIFNE